MRVHPLLGKIKDPIIRRILEDYARDVSAEVANALQGATMVVNEGGEKKEVEVVEVRQRLWPNVWQGGG